MKLEITKELIYSHLSGKTTALQKKMLEEWLQEKTNEETFYQYIFEYEKMNPQYQANLDRGLESINLKLENRAFSKVTISEGKKAQKKAYKKVFASAIAASVAFFVLFNFSYLKHHFHFKTFVSSNDKNLSINLIDGSKIRLLPNSKLEVPRFGFGSSTRKVFLFGEASFDVSHLANNQKFIVKTENDLEVVVLGTEFKVFSRGNKASVELNKGKVQLRYKEGIHKKELTMKPGDMISLNQSNQLEKIVSENQVMPEITSSQKFIFNNTSLSDFAKIMKEKYALNIKFEDDKMAKRTLEGSFQAENAEEILDLVCKIFGFNAIRKGNEIILSTHKNQPNLF